MNVLSAELADGIDEAVASPPDTEARSAAITSLIREIYEAIQWLHGGDETSEELVSLAEVVTAAHQHQLRMSAVSHPVPVDA